MHGVVPSLVWLFGGRSANANLKLSYISEFNSHLTRTALKNNWDRLSTCITQLSLHACGLTFDYTVCLRRTINCTFTDTHKNTHRSCAYWLHESSRVYITFWPQRFPPPCIQANGEMPKRSLHAINSLRTKHYRHIDAPTTFTYMHYITIYKQLVSRYHAACFSM